MKTLILILTLYLSSITITSGACAYFNRPCQEKAEGEAATCNGDTTIVRPTGTGSKQFCVDSSWHPLTETSLSNCVEIKLQTPTAADGYYLITPSGGDTITYCLGMSQPDGPFTRIFDVRMQYSSPTIHNLTINDMNVEYKKLYFVDKGTSYIDYADGGNDRWKGSGFGTYYMLLRMDTMFYYFTPLHSNSYLRLSSHAESPKTEFPRSQLYDQIVTSRVCMVSDDHVANICYNSFKMHLPVPEVHLNLFTDLETINGNTYNGNAYSYYFYIYGGSCNSSCITCAGRNECLSCTSGNLHCPSVSSSPLTGNCDSDCSACQIGGKNSFPVSSILCQGKLYIYIYINMYIYIYI